MSWEKIIHYDPMLLHPDMTLARIPDEDRDTSMYIRPEGAKQSNELSTTVYIENAVTPYHYHTSGFETFYLTAGRLETYVNHRCCVVEPGDIVQVRPYVHHGFKYLDQGTAWLESYQSMDMFNAMNQKATLRAYTPELVADEEFRARRLKRAGIMYRDTPLASRVSKYDIPEVKPADRPETSYETPYGTLCLRVGRWEYDGEKEIWEFHLKKGVELVYDMPFADDPIYVVVSGGVHVDSDRDCFDAKERDIIHIPPYLRHKLTITAEDTKLLAFNVRSKLYELMERLKSEGRFSGGNWTAPEGWKELLQDYYNFWPTKVSL